MILRGGLKTLTGNNWWGLKTAAGNFLLHFPLPFRIGGVYKIFLDPTPKKIYINSKVFKHYSITFNNIAWGDLKTPTGNFGGGLKTETGKMTNIEGYV